MIDRTEVDAMLAQRFYRLDTNGDGILSAEERAAMHRPRPDDGKDDAPRAPSA